MSSPTLPFARRLLHLGPAKASTNASLAGPFLEDDPCLVFDT
jgi:hypothetical protein